MQIRLALNLIRVYAILSAPFIPDTSKAILENLNSDNSSWPNDLKISLSSFKPGQSFDVPKNLFDKISDEKCASWDLEFSGKAL